MFMVNLAKKDVFLYELIRKVKLHMNIHQRLWYMDYNYQKILETYKQVFHIKH